GRCRPGPGARTGTSHRGPRPGRPRPCPAGAGGRARSAPPACRPRASACPRPGPSSRRGRRNARGASGGCSCCVSCGTCGRAGRARGDMEGHDTLIRPFPRFVPMSAVLTAAQTRFLRSQAHGLKALMQVGGKGVTPALLAELDAVLERHELVKVKVAAEDREARDAMIAEL